MKWLRTVNNYDVAAMAKTYREAMTTPKGLKVIVAEASASSSDSEIETGNAERLEGANVP